jgi:hypothetical protein
MSIVGKTENHVTTKVIRLPDIANVINFRGG